MKSVWLATKEITIGNLINQFEYEIIYRKNGETIPFPVVDFYDEQTFSTFPISGTAFVDYSSEMSSFYYEWNMSDLASIIIRFGDTLTPLLPGTGSYLGCRIDSRSVSHTEIRIRVPSVLLNDLSIHPIYYTGSPEFGVDGDVSEYRFDKFVPIYSESYGFGFIFGGENGGYKVQYSSPLEKHNSYTGDVEIITPLEFYKVFSTLYGFVPVQNTDTSTTGGGNGTFNFTSDIISAPTLPGVSAVASGFVKLYTPTLPQVNSLAEFMWSNAFDLATFKKLYADPMSAIIGLGFVPFTVPYLPTSENIKIGYVDTLVSSRVASSQYVTLDMGELNIEPIWGSALDYEPYTHTTLYLPYIGARTIKTDDIMGKTVGVSYNIDILTGSCVAHIICGGNVIYSFNGDLLSMIPITGNNWNELLRSTISLVGTGITALSSGGLGGLSSGTLNAVTSAKPTIQRSGAIAGASGLLAVQYPYFIFEVPRQSLAEDYNKFVGYPSNITATLSELTGYTQVEEIHLDNMSATEQEKDEIENLLRKGVII